MQELETHFGSIEHNELADPKEIEDLGLDSWKVYLVQPLREKLVRILLENIEV